jgi:BRCT domain type II-containing protein
MIGNEEKKELFESVMKMMAVEVKRMINEADSKSKDDKKEEKKGGKTVVFTGKSKYFKGDDVEKFIKKNTSYKTSHTVDDKTTLIVTGEKPGPKKMELAKDLGIPVVKEDDFFSDHGLTDELPEPIA